MITLALVTHLSGAPPVTTPPLPCTSPSGAIKLNPNYTSLGPYLHDYIGTQLLTVLKAYSGFQQVSVDPLYIRRLQMPETNVSIRGIGLNLLTLYGAQPAFYVALGNLPDNTLIGPIPLVSGRGMGLFSTLEDRVAKKFCRWQILDSPI